MRTPISPPLVWTRGVIFDVECIGVRIVRRNRLYLLRCATPVVRVKTESALQIKLSIGPRAEDQTCFWAGQELADRAGIGRVHRGGGAVGQSNNIGRVSQAGDDKLVVVAAKGHDRAEFVSPLDFIFHISTAYRVRKVIPLRGRGQSRTGAGKSGRGTTIDTNTNGGCVGVTDSVVGKSCRWRNNQF